MVTAYENAPSDINEARALVLIGGRNPTGQYQSGDRIISQYRTEFGLVTKVTDTWGEEAEYSLLRFAK